MNNQVDRKTSGFKCDRSNWKTVRLGEILKVCHGKCQHGIEAPNGKYPILGSGGEIGRTNRFLCNTPSVLIGRKGTIDIPQYMETPFWTIDTLFYTRIAESYIPKYIYYLFCTIDWERMNEASGVPSLSAKVIENLEVRVAEYRQQQAIVTTLSSIDSQISATCRLLAKYESLKKATVKLLLEPTDEIPLVAIEDGFTISGGLSATRDDLGQEGYCYLHYGDIHAASKYFFDTGKDYSSIPKLATDISKVSKTSLLEDGDIVFVDASEDTEGASKYIAIRNQKNIPYISGLHTIVAKPDFSIWAKDYLAVIFQAEFVKKQFSTLAAGTKVCGVNKSSIKKIKIPCPALSVQKSIAEKLLSIEAVFPSFQNEIKRLLELKQSMLQYFFG